MASRKLAYQPVGIRGKEFLVQVKALYIGFITSVSSLDSQIAQVQ